MSKIIEFKNWANYGSNPLGQLIENPYKHFAGSKMKRNSKTACVVEFTDLMGRKHIIVCNNRTQMKNAQSFLSIFKSESAKVKNILAEYPIKLGRIPKKYMSELRSELTAMGFTYNFINKLAGY